VGVDRRLGPVTRARAAGLAGLAVCAAAAYLPALFAWFVADDFLVLDASSRFRGIDWAFGHDTGEIGGGGHFYRPLWVSMQAGVYDVFGAHAAAWHAINLVLFAVITIEVWALARAMLSERRAWIAAAAFAVYPRHGESVAWVTGSTDLVAVALGLGALLWALYVRPEWAQALGSAVLGAAAVLSKEIAFVIPLLALIALPLPRRRRLVVFGALVAAQLAVLVARTVILHGAGGYSEYPWRPGRLVVVAVSYVLAAFSPPQLELTRFPVLVLVPLALMALFVWALLRTGGRRTAWIGLAWFAVALLPGANVAVDVNNSLGERLLFLPSVGLAIAFAAVIPSRRVWPLALAGAVALALSVLAARDWVTAGRIAHRTIPQAARLGPQGGGELMLLTTVEAYRSASVLPTSNTLDAALARIGRRDLRTSFCSQLYVRDQRPVVQVTGTGGRFEVRTTWSAPFDVPVTRRAEALNLDCSYVRANGSHWPIGLTREVTITASPPSGAVLAYFDGRDLRRVS
jgi:hypothetical protein